MPDYENNLYSHPEKAGLSTVAELEYSDGDYQFDTRVVWRRDSDGQLLSARDSGCSCPSPFESTELKDLQEVNSTSWLKEEIAEQSKHQYGNVNLAQDAAAFLEKVDAALPKRLSQ